MLNSRSIFTSSSSARVLAIAFTTCSSTETLSATSSTTTGAATSTTGAATSTTGAATSSTTGATSSTTTAFLAAFLALGLRVEARVVLDFF